jgi:hypothetical protein
LYFEDYHKANKRSYNILAACAWKLLSYRPDLGVLSFSVQMGRDAPRVRRIPWSASVTSAAVRGEGEAVELVRLADGDQGARSMVATFFSATAAEVR